VNVQAKNLILYASVAVVGLYFLIVGLIEAADFLQPLALAVLMAMVLIPLARKLEGWGASRFISALIASLVAIFAALLITGLFAVQVNNVAEDWPKIKENLKPQVDRLKAAVEDATGLTAREQEAFLERNIPLADEEGEASQPSATPSDKEKSVSSDTVGKVGEAVAGVFGFMGSVALVFVYIFFLLFYRHKIRLSLLKFFSDGRRENAEKVMAKSVRLSENYLLGRLLLITFLAVIYSVGLSLAGIKNAIFVSIFAALLTLIPYIGNIVGFIVAMSMAAFSGGGLGTYAGVVLTFGITQIVESYILQPYVVGDKVDLNPLATIVVVVVGGAVWGVMGMIISIPLFGILKIVFDSIAVTAPLGYALGDEDVGSDEPNFLERWVKRVRGRMG